MTRETKVGLLIGLGVILLIGIIVSDHLSVVQHQDPAKMTTFADQAQESIHQPPRPRDQGGADVIGSDGQSHDRALTEVRPTQPLIVEPAPAATAREPIYTPDELDSRQIIDTAEGPARTNPPIAGIFANADRNLPDDPAEGMVDDVDMTALPRPIAVTPDTPRVLLLDGSAPRIEEPTALPEPPARRPGSELIHYVKSGENLYNIAETYYGNGEYWRSIAKQNPDTVGTDGRVATGARLVIPNRSGLIDSGMFTPMTTERVVSVTTAQPNTPAKTIKVGAGETLSGLAAKHLGSSARWKDLLDANRDQMDAPEELQAGMVLMLPVASSAPAVVQNASTTVAKPRAATVTPDKTYTVKAGDNLTKIAEKALGSGDRWEELFEANRDKLASADDVKVGQTLVLPR